MRLVNLSNSGLMKNKTTKSVSTNSQLQDLGVYVHWPYCARICPYCDFNIYKNRNQDNTKLIKAIIKDMQYWRNMSGARRLKSIHFGGGTPSLIKPDELGSLIKTTKNLWSANDDIEIGLEANPNDISTNNLKSWKQAGIERLSIGVQSFNDSALKFLRRDHDGKAAKISLKQAVKIIDRVSVDLIFGWKGQTKNMLDQDINYVLQSGAQHISTYQLTIEASTAFGRAAKRGDNKAVNIDDSAELFEHVINRLENAGFEQYEVSNFAKNKPNRSRHNLLYWQGKDYIGLGPGAHGRLCIDKIGNIKKLAIINALKPDDYIKSVQISGKGVAEQEIMDKADIANEYVLMGLRIQEGISLKHYKNISGHDLNPEIIADFIDNGLLQINEDRLFATKKGRMVLDIISTQLLL